MSATTHIHRWVYRWWNGDAGASGTAADLLLAPAELAYRSVSAFRNAAYERGWLEPERAPIPVISVGNIAVGGSGKTPFAAWLAGRLRAEGNQPAIALRGYGMDEVELHRELNPKVPVFVADRRAEAVRQAAGAGCDCAVLDDAFQHRQLSRDLDIVLVAAERWTGAPRLLPRGPWRESPAALARADVIVVVSKTDHTAGRRTAHTLAGLFPNMPIVRCAIEPSGLEPLHPNGSAAWDLSGMDVLAVASLADPRPFAEHLRRLGSRVEVAAFPDHYPFQPADAHRLLDRAKGRPLLMTGKEAVKLRALVPRDAAAFVLRQAVRICEGEDQLDAALARALAS